MKGLREEILQIPDRAREVISKHQGLKLPTGLPYIGMGSSYFAPLTLYYGGADLEPQIASEYYHYLADTRPSTGGVLISQSGESSETVWCLEKLQEVTAITDQVASTLGQAVEGRVVPLHSGVERYSSTKSYVNTLLVLYQGLGIDPADAVQRLTTDFEQIDQTAKDQAAQIAAYLAEHQVTGLYVIGSGPNIGTAYQGALTLSETTKLAWIGMPVAQYDHGPKETADDSVVIILNAGGKDAKRIRALHQVLSQSNAMVAEVTVTSLSETLSPVLLITQLNLVMDYLADALGVGDTFQLGGKVTRVDESAK